MTRNSVPTDRVTLTAWGADRSVAIDGITVGVLRFDRLRRVFTPSDGLVAIGIEPGSEWASPKSAAYAIASVA